MPHDSLYDAREEMLQQHLCRRGIRDRRVLDVMARVPRERFVPESSREDAYADRALPIACRQTISQPYIVALMTEALELAGSERVLEIGTGSGYQTAVLAELATEVISVERHEELSQQAGEMLESLGYANVALHVGDGTLGLPERGPFDRIIVTAAAVEFPPALFAQLAEGGVAVVPVGNRDYQVLQAIEKIAGGRKTRNLTACRFVPLVGAQGFHG